MSRSVVSGFKSAYSHKEWQEHLNKVAGCHVKLCLSRRSKSIRITVDAITGHLRLSAPVVGISLNKIVRFVQEYRPWIAKTRAIVPEAIPFAVGRSVFLRGHPVTLENPQNMKEAVKVGGNLVSLSCDPRFFERRVYDYFRVEARLDFENAIERFLKSLYALHPDAIRFKRLYVRDMRSRWGSCSSQGNISLNWRLIMAPPFILDYVVAHEIAHLKERCHDGQFWGLCAQLFPETSQAKIWLRHNGMSLQRVGMQAAK